MFTQQLRPTKKPGKNSMVLISADGTKGTIDHPSQQLADEIEQAPANHPEVVFYMKPENPAVGVLMIGGTSHSF